MKIAKEHSAAKHQPSTSMRSSFRFMESEIVLVVPFNK